MRRVLLGVALILVFTTFSLPAFSQAIAESVMLGAGSSTSAVKAGSALGSALNQSSKQLAGRVQQQLSRPSQTKTSQAGRNLSPKNQTARPDLRSMPQSGSLVVSIRGAEPNCPLTKQETATAQGKAAAEAYPKKCNSNASVRPESQKYNSVVTLPSPK